METLIIWLVTKEVASVVEHPVVGQLPTNSSWLSAGSLVVQEMVALEEVMLDFVTFVMTGGVVSAGVW